MCAPTLLRIQGKFLDALALHGKTQLALDECLHQQGEEIQGEERLNAALVLQEHGSDLVHDLDLFEALFDRGLALVGLKNLERYCTGYLGDIGVPPPYGPMDFSGWFEDYLDGHWYTFDARNNTPRSGRVLIARGRDAADVAISSTFGPNTLKSFKVWTDEVIEGQSG